MKKIRNLILVVLFMSTQLNCVNSQNREKEIINKLNKFYIDYNYAWENETDPIILIQKITDLRQTYCSRKLQSKLNENIQFHGLDHDIIINDLYTTTELISSLSIVKDSIKPNNYRVLYLAETEDALNNIIKTQVCINLKIITEDNTFKIDSIW
ncbi:hypothetical protein [Marinifilum caeruleilacunae]|uniref:DUF4252 domain-containing protein n=1 Tax=Marinifilum caeruleilacunae TaxID=2499076 RepID=A0ABX1X2G8_9BACT|nr:hypothetical protein [Marinifilum caeruleilacunae]NOU62285.1 hypothetical protein [Marinifilum caeruleilacunae]